MEIILLVFHSFKKLKSSRTNVLQQKEELNVLLIGYLVSYNNNSGERQHFTELLIEPHGIPARWNDWLIPLFRLHSTRVHGDGELMFSWKSVKARFFAPLVSPSSLRWKFSTDGKQQNWDARSNNLIPTFTGKLKISLKLNFISLLELLLFGGDLFLSLLCASFLGEGFGEDEGGCRREGQLRGLREGVLLFPSAHSGSTSYSLIGKCIIIDKRRKNMCPFN